MPYATAPMSMAAAPVFCRRAARAAAVLPALLVILLGGCREPGGPTTQEVARNLRGHAHVPSARLAARADSASGWAWAWYQRRDFAPAWTAGGEPTRSAEQLVAFLASAPSHGLPAAPYGAAPLAAALRRAAEAPLDAGTAAALDFALTRAYFRYAWDLARGRVSPRATGAEWYADHREVDPTTVLDQAVAAPEPATILASLAPTQGGYARLRAARARYAGLARSGGWAPLPADALEPGARGAAVTALRTRLAVEGDLAAGGARGDLYDDALAAAVARFQTRHGLAPSGVVDAATRAQLDIPAAARVAAIDLNLERWRWLPEQFGERYLLVNIPEYALHAVEHGRSVLDMRVIVGKPANRTPVFSDTMQYIQLHPYWNVPPSIVRSEILPAVRRDPGYLAEHGFEVVANWQNDSRVDPSSVDWSTVSPASLRIRQTPGGENALGRIKFVFPNQLNIYLHDTPGDALFARTTRSLSHGCVRLEKPELLAAYVLRGSAWDEPKIRASLDAGEHRDVSLPEKLPVHIVYLTAWVDDGGVVHFRPDVYGHDERLAAALRGGAGAEPPGSRS